MKRACCNQPTIFITKKNIDYYLFKIIPTIFIPRKNVAQFLTIKLHIQTDRHKHLFLFSITLNNLTFQIVIAVCVLITYEVQNKFENESTIAETFDSLVCPVDYEIHWLSSAPPLDVDCQTATASMLLVHSALV